MVRIQISLASQIRYLETVTTDIYGEHNFVFNICVLYLIDPLAIIKK